MTVDPTTAIGSSSEPSEGPGWLGLEPAEGPGRYSFTLTHSLARFDGKLFGGTGLAIAVAALEAETGRGALWLTVQFVGSADLGERIDCHVEVLASGRSTSQVRFTATVGDRLVLAALGATAQQRDDGFGARLGRMPEVSAPEESPPLELGFPVSLEVISRQGPFAMADYRRATGAAAAAGADLVWARMRTVRQSRSTVAYLADFVPSAVVRAAGRVGGGTSLDNSIRFGPAVPPGTDWLLIDNDPYLADNGYVHGGARLWSADGVLLGVASQTAVARFVD